MTINKLTAIFGRLKNDTLILSPGLNIIVAPNESGKSTWCAFIRAMLYGISTSERDKAGHLSDKTRYRPWDGGAMEGLMELSCTLGDITLERGAITKSRSKSSASALRELRATFTGTGEPVPGITAETAGETLTGVPETVFRRSAFISQSGIRVDQTPELERRIASLVSTGDETTSYTEADARLREWQRRRKFKKSGDIPALESRITALDDELYRLEAAVEHAAGLRLEVASLSDKRAALERELLLHDRLEASAKRERVNAALRGKAAELTSLAAELEDAKIRRDNAERNLGDINKRCDASVCNGRDTDRIISEAERLTKRGGLRIWMTVLTAAAAAIAVVFGNPVVMPKIAWGALASAVTATVILLAFQLPAARKLKALLGEIGVSSVTGLYGAVREYGGLVQSVRDAESELAASGLALENAEKLHSGARAALSDAEAIAREYTDAHDYLPADRDVSEAAPARTRAETESELARVTELLSSRRTVHDMAQGGMQAMGDPLVMRCKRAELESELAEKTLQYDALTMAIDALSKANAQLQARFAPMLSREAGKLLSRLTGGRYESLVFDRGFNASAKQTGDAVSRDAPALSDGTIDQIYLALRLAVMKLVLPEDDSCPIILDDALCNFDDARAEMALHLLREISETRQVILFTCHQREANILRHNEKVNIVKASHST